MAQEDGLAYSDDHIDALARIRDAVSELMGTVVREHERAIQEQRP
jgi:hypothetical protein